MVDSVMAEQQQQHGGIVEKVAGVAGAVTGEAVAFHGDFAEFAKTAAAFGRPKMTANEELSLFEQVSTALFRSVMVYFMGEVRGLIREKRDEVVGDPDSIQEFLDLPVQDIVILKILKENMGLLESSLKRTDLEVYMGALKTYAKEYFAMLEEPDQKQSMMRRSSIFQAIDEPTEIVVFDDRYAQKELVYAIVLNRKQRQICVIFRGSVTVRDWQVDSSVFMQFVENPLYNAENVSIPQTRCCGIHSGFQDYLFGTTSKSNTNSKYDQILAHVRRLLEANKDYALLVTGHSLGGALATLCSFHMAAEVDLLTPVTCISFASPRVGNISFVRAFQELEIQGKLICFRVANEKDIITHHPDRLTVCTSLYQDLIFRQVGIELKLHHESKWRKRVGHRVRYIRVHRSRIHQFGADFYKAIGRPILRVLGCTVGCCVEDYMRWHSCSEYMRRLQRESDDLLKMSTRDIVDDYRNDVGRQESDE